MGNSAGCGNKSIKDAEKREIEALQSKAKEDIERQRTQFETEKKIAQERIKAQLAAERRSTDEWKNQALEAKDQLEKKEADAENRTKEALEKQEAEAKIVHLKQLQAQKQELEKLRADEKEAALEERQRLLGEKEAVLKELEQLNHKLSSSEKVNHESTLRCDYLQNKVMDLDLELKRAREEASSAASQMDSGPDRLAEEIAMAEKELENLKLRRQQSAPTSPSKSQAGVSEQTEPEDPEKKQAKREAQLRAAEARKNGTSVTPKEAAKEELPKIYRMFSGSSKDANSPAPLRDIGQRKTDPDDMQAYFWHDLEDKYKDMFSKADLEKYWNETCTPVAPASEVGSVKGNDATEPPAKLPTNSAGNNPDHAQAPALPAGTAAAPAPRSSAGSCFSGCFAGLQGS